MDILIHVGLHKTGTTSVQDHLYRKRECLLAEGILYPNCGLFGSQHALIPGSIIPKHYFLDRVERSLCTRDYLDQLASEAKAAKPDLVILSSEVFSEITHNKEACLGIIQQISEGFTSCKLLLTVRNSQELALSALKHSARERIRPWIQDPIGSYIKAYNSISSLQAFWENAGFPICSKSIDDNSSENLTDFYFGEVIAAYSQRGRACISTVKSLPEKERSQKLNSDKLAASNYAILFLIGNTDSILSLYDKPIFSIIARLIEKRDHKKALRKINTSHLIGYLEYFRLKADRNSHSRFGTINIEDKRAALNIASTPIDAIQAIISIATEIMISL
jgi:hypothetical protein